MRLRRRLCEAIKEDWWMANSIPLNKLVVFSKSFWITDAYKNLWIWYKQVNFLPVCINYPLVHQYKPAARLQEAHLCLQLLEDCDQTDAVRQPSLVTMGYCQFSHLGYNTVSKGGIFYLLFFYVLYGHCDMLICSDQTSTEVSEHVLHIWEVFRHTFERKNKEKQKISS